MRRAQVGAARAIVRRGIARGEVAPDTSATLLLDTLTSGAMMHALITPADRQADLARNSGAYVIRLVDFLLGAVTLAFTLGFSSMLNGENPQSSVAPSCSFEPAPGQAGGFRTWRSWRGGCGEADAGPVRDKEDSPRVSRAAARRGAGPGPA